MVRKRKNSEEDIAVQRLTRQRRLEEDNANAGPSLLNKTSQSPKKPKTPSTGKPSTRKHGRGVDIFSSSSDSDIENKVEQSAEMVNHGKTAVRALLGTECYSTRSRARKDVSLPVNRDSELGDESLHIEPKRQTRRTKKVLATADNTLTDDGAQLRTPVKLTRSQAKTFTRTSINQHDDGELSSTSNYILGPKNAGNSTSTVSQPIRDTRYASRSLLRRAFETPRKSLAQTQSQTLGASTDIVTPESSPILINLTPHRSTKTPKKSPLNIGSPKTHSESPLRLSKTPRKLPVMVDSPATSDKSSISLNSSTPNGASLLVNRPDPYVILTDFKKEATVPSDSTNTSFKPNETVSPSTPSFITTTKVRLKKNSAKLSPLAKVGNSKSLQNSSTSPKQKLLSPGAQMTPEISLAKTPIKKVGILASKIRKSPIMSPVVLIRRTSPMTKSQFSTPNKSPINTPNHDTQAIVNLESPKRLRSTLKKRSPITSVKTPLHPAPLPEGSTVDKFKKMFPSPSHVAPKKSHLLLEFNSSSLELTPRVGIRRSLHLTPDFVALSSGSTSSPKKTPRKLTRTSPRNFGILKESNMIGDESLELIDGSQFMNESEEVFTNSGQPKDGTYELSNNAGSEKDVEKTVQEAEEINTTYELADPKTPNLQMKTRKRSLSHVDPSNCTPDAKKKCRVRFASPAREESPKSPMMHSIRKSLPTVNTPAKQRIGGNRLTSRLRASTTESIHRRSRSLTKLDEKSPNIRRASKRRSISASESTNKTPKLNQSTLNSVNRLSRPRQSISSESKLEIKMPVPRRAPNFSQIHEKKFAQMESLVDAKKRVAKRHVELNTVPSTFPSNLSAATVLENSTLQLSKKVLPSEVQKNGCNRFGFKLRKAEAVQLIGKKTPMSIRSKKLQEANRTILKGVRTNRRFELQMKARNINQ